MKRRMKNKSALALVVVLSLFCWQSFYFIIINSQVAQYGIVHLYEPSKFIRWAEFGGAIAMFTLGIYVLSDFLRRGK